METTEGVVTTRSQEIHENYCREMVCIIKKLEGISPGCLEKRDRLMFRLNDIKNRLIPQLFSATFSG